MNGVALVVHLSQLKEECDKAVKALEKLQGVSAEGKPFIGVVRFESSFVSGHSNYNHIDEGTLNSLLVDTALDYYRQSSKTFGEKLQKANEAIEMAFMK
jgi:hypothetical protein